MQFSAAKPVRVVQASASPHPYSIPRPGVVEDIISLSQSADRGLSVTPSNLSALQKAVVALRQTPPAAAVSSASLSRTWKLHFTTEKETLFILQSARWFGTQAGDVFQVIDVPQSLLQNVITFPPEGSFVVDSTIQREGDQRVSFKFTSATLQLPQGRKVKLPPFGQGWFDNLYVDDEWRVAFDIRGDTLICKADGPPRLF